MCETPHNSLNKRNQQKDLSMANELVTSTCSRQFALFARKRFAWLLRDTEIVEVINNVMKVKVKW